ncbi:MAG: hypothetical protein KJ847_02090, partial [Firmicutes bacterium]|nr:hypothetical protein [Bacillota bacterium]
QTVLGISREGYLKRATVRSYRSTENPMIKDDDSMLFEGELSTLDTMLVFTDQGNYVYLPVFKVPEYKWKELGTHINNIVQLEDNEKIIKIVHVKDFDADLHLFFTTKDNLVKLTKLSDFNISRYSKTVKAINLNKGDEVVSIDIAESLDAEVLIATEKGLALRFSISEVPITGTTAKGVKGLNLTGKQKLASGIVLKDHHDLIILTNRGTIKRIDVSEIPKKKRTNKGVQLYKVVRSNPYLITDLCILNGTQYKNRATVYVTTTKTRVDINSFDIKRDKTENGKLFIKSKMGKPMFISVQEMEIDPSLPVLSDYVKEKQVDTVQQTLFE